MQFDIYKDVFYICTMIKRKLELQVSKFMKVLFARQFSIVTSLLLSVFVSCGQHNEMKKGKIQIGSILIREHILMIAVIILYII